MNARMRRIDLFCKLMGPLTISLVAIASTEIAIWTTLGMNVASVLVEYIFIEQVRRPAVLAGFSLSLLANQRFRFTKECAPWSARTLMRSI